MAIKSIEPLPHAGNIASDDQWAPVHPVGLISAAAHRAHTARSTLHYANLQCGSQSKSLLHTGLLAPFGPAFVCPAPKRNPPKPAYWRRYLRAIFAPFRSAAPHSIAALISIGQRPREWCRSETKNSVHQSRPRDRGPTAGKMRAKKLLLPRK